MLASHPLPLLSIVVIGRNEGARLTTCLNSLQPLRKAFPLTELFYVDSASTDDSIQRANQEGATVLSVSSPKLSAALARNTGWQAAHGEFILFLDGDTVLDADFISLALPLFADPKVAVVCGQRRELYPSFSIYNYVCDLDWIYPTGLVDFCGGDALIRQTSLVQVAGYRADLIAGEEPELCQRLRLKGYKVWRLDHLITLHDLNITTFSQYWKRSFRTGFAYAEIAHCNHYQKNSLWQRASLHNFFKIFSFFSILIISLILMPYSFIPLIFLFILISLLLVRTAFKAADKTTSWKGRFLYALHTHFQHFPLFFGQCTYWLNYFRGLSRYLIEYK